MAIYDNRRRSRTRAVATNETGTSAGCGVSYGAALSANRHSGQLARAARAIIVAALLTATGQPARAELIGFEPPAYAVGSLPGVWTTNSDYCQVTTSLPAGGAQCLAVGRCPPTYAEASYPIRLQAVEQDWQLSVKLRPDVFQPSLSDPCYRLAGIGVQDAANNCLVSVDFDLIKPLGALAKSTSWQIWVTDAIGVHTMIGTFLPGQYHDVSLRWVWISRTLCISATRPDGTAYEFTVAGETNPPGNVALRGSDRAGLLARYDELAIGERPCEPGDANTDGVVDVGDLGILGANYGRASDATWAMADFTGDGAVDVGDLGVLGANYGRRATGLSPVPEPATLLLLAISGPALCRRRK